MNSRSTIVAVATVAAVVIPATAANAALPMITFGNPKPVVTLGQDCQVATVNLTASTDGTYRGYVYASCFNPEEQIYYVQRSPSGKWTSTKTPFDGLLPQATTSDSTGTYFVGTRSDGRLYLSKRNSNGTYAKSRMLSHKFHHPQNASIIASGGKYWVTWTDDIPYDNGTFETRTMGAPVDQHKIREGYGNASSIASTLLARPGTSTALIGDNARSTAAPAGGPANYSTFIQTRDNGQWTRARQLVGDVETYQEPAVYRGTTTYVLASRSCGHDAERPVLVTLDPDTTTELAGADGTTCTGAGANDNLAGTGFLKVGDQLWLTGGSSTGDYVWRPDSAGHYSGAPSAQLQPAAVGIFGVGVYARAGKLFRLAFVNGQRLLEQDQQ